MESERCVRVLCRGKITAFCRDPGIYWLVGSPLFLPPLTVVSALRCLHRSVPGDDPFSPDYGKEADDLRTLLLRGFDVVGALFVSNAKSEENAIKAINASLRMKKLLSDKVGHDIIGAAADSTAMDIHFYASESRSSSSLKPISTVHYEDSPERVVWENGCLLRCQMEFTLPVYVPENGTSGQEGVKFVVNYCSLDLVTTSVKDKDRLGPLGDAEMLSSSTDAAIAKLRDPQVVYLIEGADVTQQSLVLRGTELSSNTDITDNKPEGTTSMSGKNTLPCSHFLPESKGFLSSTSRESADAIRVRVFFSQSGNSTKTSAPIAEYFPASEAVRLVVANFKVDVLCYASRDFPVFSAVSRLVIPGIADQFATLHKTIGPKLSSQQYQLCPYHFSPPGIFHPITAIYDLRYGESEKVQADVRRSLHLRLGLPLDRPLLLIANSVVFSGDIMGTSTSKRSGVIRDVHVDIRRSGVSGGLASLVEGSYEYYHYLQDGYDDNGWGCAYRSLQTIISWFKLHHYTSIQVPSHRDIQQALVEIGDKEPYFVGSREWIGAIELSFVLDKLLGVSCKIINVRSGAELPEKCRELSLHFETQGTPVMIGGGVLAYTLLGVDYNEVSGDCAFLILDPHYTGSDDRKKIINGGWCGWKKPVDSKGKNFFLHDKFYNLLLPQRPNMV